MKNIVVIKKKIKKFNKIITVSGDKSLSIRWVLFASLSSGISKAYNLLLSEDVIAAINAVKKLGIEVKFKKNFCEIKGNGLYGYKYHKNIIIDAKNSGTLGRLILGLIIDTPFKIKLIGDKSLSKRDFRRVTDPLSKFGAKFKLNNNKRLPLTVIGTKQPKPIKYFENKGSAQCKSSIIFAGLKTAGNTIIKAKKSRNHSELLCRYLQLPVKIKKRKNFDIINVTKAKTIKPLNYKIPSDVSSSAFFIILTVLTPNSSIKIKNVNVNPSRTGVIKILKIMGVKITFENKKMYKGELVADIIVKSPSKIKPINCPIKFNSQAIDEFLLIFLVAAKAKGVSNFKNLEELNQKESPRLELGSKILQQIGIKTIVTKDSIKIFGNPDLKVSKKITIKDYLKDHRVFMTSVIAAMTFGGHWIIHDKDSISTSFPSFLKIINKIKNEK